MGPELVSGTVDDLPNFCGAEEQVQAVTQRRAPPTHADVEPRLERAQAVFAVALHMHQPLIPAGGDQLRTARVISNLEHMLRHQGTEAHHNATVFLECYRRMGGIIKELVQESRAPRIMLDYSGELLFGLQQMGREDVLQDLREITCDHDLRRHVEWLGTMWGHAVIPSTPLPDLGLHLKAWQHHFAATFGLEALERVRGFSPPEMHLPNHPDAAHAFVLHLRERGYQWLLVQEDTVETLDGRKLEDRFVPHRLIARNSCGEEASIVAIIKTQGSDTKLVGQMQPFHEARSLNRRTVGGRPIPPMVCQIGDGENGNVMMNEFPSAYRQAIERSTPGPVIAVTGSEYLAFLERSGIREGDLPACRPAGQGPIFDRIDRWEPDAADRAIALIRRERPEFTVEGRSWTDHLSWERGYENVLEPMNDLSARWHRVLDRDGVETGGRAYRNALFHLLTAQTSCFRYWGQGTWTEYGREICRRGIEILAHDFTHLGPAEV